MDDKITELIRQKIGKLELADKKQFAKLQPKGDDDGEDWDIDEDAAQRERSMRGTG